MIPARRQESRMRHRCANMQRRHGRVPLASLRKLARLEVRNRKGSA